MSFYRSLINASLLAVLVLSVVSAVPSAGSVSVSFCNAIQARGDLIELRESGCGHVLSLVGGRLDRKKRDLIKLNGSADVHANVFVNAMSGCNDLVNGLTVNLGGMLTGSASTDLLCNRLGSTVNSVSTLLESSLKNLKNVAVCTDQKVAATTYEAFHLFVDAETKIMANITATVNNASVKARADLKAALHLVLLRLQTDVSAYVDALFHYISADLDTDLNLRAQLALSIEKALQACV